MGAAFLGGKICGEGGGPVVRTVWGEFARGGRPQGKPPQAASARSAGFGGAEAPCGRIWAALRGGGGAAGGPAYRKSETRVEKSRPVGAAFGVI